jgi:hypothetical protein
VRRRRRGRRVVTPDGHVWFVRRRRARRRPFWSRRGPERFHDEEELPDPAEKIPLPGVLDLFTTRGEDIGQPGFDRYLESDRVKGGRAIFAITVALVVVALLAWLTVRHVLPWLVPLFAANARLLGGIAAALVVLAALNQLHRPWWVELQRQGLADAPRRVWRVQGWRRSGRLMGELTAAIREGRIDNRRAVILRTDGHR